MAFGLGAALLGSAGLSTVGSLLANRSRNNPANAAAPYLQNNPAIGREAYNPFIQQGQQANQRLQPEYDYGLQQRPDYSQMANNPVDFLNSILGQYQPSAGFDFKRKLLEKGAHSTAAAGGFAGTENDVLNRTQLINDLLNGDIQQFLENVGSIQNRGLAGQEGQYGYGLRGLEGQNERGYNASSSLADYLGTSNLNSAANAYGGRNQRNTGISNTFSALSNLISSGAGIAGAGGFNGFGGGSGAVPTNNSYDFRTPRVSSGMYARSGLGGR